MFVLLLCLLPFSFGRFVMVLDPYGLTPHNDPPILHFL